MTRFLLRAAVAMAFSAAAAATWAAPAAPDPQTEAAFTAAYGQTAPVTRSVVRPANPPGCDCSGGPVARVSLTVTPGRLIDLGDSRYALVALETDATGAHPSPGAVSVAYLTRTVHDWRLARRWDELAWMGGDGVPADETRTLDRKAAPPLLFAVHHAMHEGMATSTAWAIDLSPDAPRLIGFFPLGGALDPSNGCAFDTCGAWRYSGEIRPAWSPTTLFTVTYRGWREWPGQPSKGHFVASAGYHLVAGKLLPNLWLPLPDCGGACANGPGYPAS